MTLSLGGLTLSDHLVLNGLDGTVGGHQVRKTLGGSVRVRSLVGSTRGGRKLNLSGVNHFTLGQITAIRAIEAAGQAVTLVHPRGTFSVVVLGIAEPTSILDLVDPPDDELYSATIILQEL